MITKWVFHLSRWSEWVSALFLLVVALRFSGAAFVHVIEAKLESAQTPPRTAVSGIAPLESLALGAPSSAEALLKALQSKLPLPDGKEPLSNSGPVANYTTGEAVQVQLMVSLGPDRSEIFVDGAAVGRTPFIGDVACRVGDKLKVDLIPAKGVPLSIERVCMPEVIRIDAVDTQGPAAK